MDEGQKRIRLTSMRRYHYEHTITVLKCVSEALVNIMLHKEKCRVVFEYDPTEDGLAIYKEISQDG